MQADPQYGDVLAEVMGGLAERVDWATSQGIARDRIVVDPGIGFGKTQAHNLALLRGLSTFHDLGVPVLLGASRKRFIGSIGGAESALDRMPGSVAVALWAAAQGAQILRVHDVAETAQALRLCLAMARGSVDTDEMPQE
jgi:dihydropteroate synthase